MPLTYLAAILIVLSVAGYVLGSRRAISFEHAGGVRQRLHSQPGYHGWYVALMCGLPSLLFLLLWIAAEAPIIRALVVSGLPRDVADMPAAQLNLLMAEVQNLAYGLVPLRDDTAAHVVEAAERYRGLRNTAQAAIWVLALSLAGVGVSYGYRRLAPELRARHFVETVSNWILVVSSLIAILTTLGIILSLVFEASRFFAEVSPIEFLFGTRWVPSADSFGAVPLFTGTLLIAAIAMAVAVPIGLMSAIYLSEYAPKHLRAWAKPVLEILAGIPTVVYGFFAALTVAPLVREVGTSFGLEVNAQSALAAGLVMGIMIIPFVSSLSDDVINAVPQSLRDGSYGCGATKAETIRQIILPAALPGIGASVILAFSRALGETMIVAMAAGLAGNLTLNPLDQVTTVTVQIALLLAGDQEFDSAKTLSLFGLGLVLFVVTLALNIFALRIVSKYREKYD
jgi:phosphate transport system permease protein